MKFYPQRKKLRLEKYNYSENGYYFVTICVKNREHFLGEIQEGEMMMNDNAKIAEKVLLELPEHYVNCMIDEYIFMPNHFHGIFIIQNTVGNGLGPFREPNESFREGNESFREPNELFREGNATFRENNESFREPKKIHGLSEIIRGFKTFSSKNINASQNEIYFSWQKSFFDVIIRNEEQLEKTREYIIMNPKKWDEDVNNSKNIKLGKK